MYNNSSTRFYSHACRSVWAKPCRQRQTDVEDYVITTEHCLSPFSTFSLPSNIFLTVVGSVGGIIPCAVEYSKYNFGHLKDGIPFSLFADNSGYEAIVASFKLPSQQLERLVSLIILFRCICGLCNWFMQ